MRTYAYPLYLAFGLCLTACFSSHGDGDDPPDVDRCDMTKECLSADAIGCCTGGATQVSVCSACPTGTVERRSCRTSGCEDPPDPCMTTGSGDAAEPPGQVPVLLCYTDLGGGCCGSQVYSADLCGRCPTGTVPQSACTRGTDGSCGCNTLDDADAGAGGAAPPPGDEDPQEPPGAPLPPAECYRDHGGGCCGEYAGQPNECGCPPGTTLRTSCTAFAMDVPAGGENFLIPPTPSCRVNHGGGCCGDYVQANACTGACPTGSIEEWNCTDLATDDGGARPPPDPAPGAPAPIPTCRQDLGGGCCGDAVELNACTGSCPEAAIYEWDCQSFAPSC